MYITLKLEDKLRFGYDILSLSATSHTSIFYQWVNVKKKTPDDPNKFQLRCFFNLERMIKCDPVKTIILTAAEKTHFMCPVCLICMCVSLCS